MPHRSTVTNIAQLKLGGFLIKNGLLSVDSDGSFEWTPLGEILLEDLLGAMGELLHFTKTEGMASYETFLRIMGRIVPAYRDVILIRDRKVFMTERERGDPFFCGYHFPGSYIQPHKNPFEMAQYIVDQEIGGVTLLSARNLGVIDNPENQRFHDVGILTHVEFVGNPVAKGGVRFGWFSEPPANTIPHHAKDTYWNLIQPLLI